MFYSSFCAVEKLIVALNFSIHAWSLPSFLINFEKERCFVHLWFVFYFETCLRKSPLEIDVTKHSHAISRDFQRPDVLACGFLIESIILGHGIWLFRCRQGWEGYHPFRLLSRKLRSASHAKASSGCPGNRQVRKVTASEFFANAAVLYRYAWSPTLIPK